MTQLFTPNSLLLLIRYSSSLFSVTENFSHGGKYENESFADSVSHFIPQKHESVNTRDWSDRERKRKSKLLGIRLKLKEKKNKKMKILNGNSYIMFNKILKILKD